MSQPRPTNGPSTTRHAITLAGVCFFLNGLAVGTFGASLPGIRAALGIDEKYLGYVLVTTGIAAIISMQIMGPLGDKSGPARPSVASGVLAAIGLLVASQATSFMMLEVGAVLYGLGVGSMDIAMNSLGVISEKRSRGAIMSRLHALFSVGGFAGPVLVLGVTAIIPGSTSWPLVTAAVIVTVPCALWWVWLRGRYRNVASWRPVDDHGDDEAGRRARRRIPPVAWLLGTLGLVSGLAEGTAFDWSSIHVTDVAGVSPGVGAMGLACFSAAMVVSRVGGDALIERFGRHRVVPAGAVLSAIGFAATFSGTSLLTLGVAWALVGCGVGVVNPQIYAQAGYLGGGRVLAMVTSMSYVAFLSGPALVGFTAASMGIRTTMVIPLVAAMIAAAIAWPVFTHLARRTARSGIE